MKRARQSLHTLTHVRGRCVQVRNRSEGCHAPPTGSDERPDRYDPDGRSHREDACEQPPCSSLTQSFHPPWLSCARRRDRAALAC